MVRTKLDNGCSHTPMPQRPPHPAEGQFTPEASRTQAPVTFATEPVRRRDPSYEEGSRLEAYKVTTTGRYNPAEPSLTRALALTPERSSRGREAEAVRRAARRTPGRDARLNFGRRPAAPVLPSSSPPACRFRPLRLAHGRAAAFALAGALALLLGAGAQAQSADTTAPTLVGGTVRGSTVRLYFSVPMNTTTTPTVAGFTLTSSTSLGTISRQPD